MPRSLAGLTQMEARPPWRHHPKLEPSWCNAACATAAAAYWGAAFRVTKEDGLLGKTESLARFSVYRPDPRRYRGAERIN